MDQDDNAEGNIGATSTCFQKVCGNFDNVLNEFFSHFYLCASKRSLDIFFLNNLADISPPKWGRGRRISIGWAGGDNFYTRKVRN